jgi:hypothetical protein
MNMDIFADAALTRDQFNGFLYVESAQYHLVGNGYTMNNNLGDGYTYGDLELTVCSQVQFPFYKLN